MIPDNMSPEKGAIAQPAAIGVHAVEVVAKVHPGETVVVLVSAKLGASVPR